MGADDCEVSVSGNGDWNAAYDRFPVCFYLDFGCYGYSAALGGLDHRGGLVSEGGLFFGFRLVRAYVGSGFPYVLFF